MRVLLCAYFCEPHHKGGESGVGWRWALEAAKQGNEVWVLTRDLSREKIEHEIAALQLPVNFVFHSPPQRLRRVLGRLGLWRITYMTWQFTAYRRAVKLHEKIRFDVVHHLTMGDFRHPSFLGRLGARFVFGPVGGGERTPIRLRQGFGPAGWWSELLRDVGIALPRLDPLSRSCFERADLILVRTEATLQRLPRGCRHKSKVLLGIGVDPVPRLDKEIPEPGPGLKILFVGRLIPWKGVHLLLHATAELAKKYEDVSVTIVGRGPWERHLRELSTSLGVAARVRWITEWMSESALSMLFSSHHLFVFPSLHEAGGMAVLDALGHALPVVCIGIGGPATIVDESCGRIVCARSQSTGTLISSLVATVDEIASTPGLRQQLSRGAIQKAKRHRWSDIVEQAYAPHRRCSAP